MNPSGFGALCALHSTVPASRTCARCGNFMCEECSQAGAQTQCPTCRELASGGGHFPFSRTDFDFERLWNFAFERFKLEWVMLSVCVLIFFAVSMAVGVFGAAFRAIGTAIVGEGGPGDMTKVVLVAGIGGVIQQLVQGMVQGVVQMGLFRVCIDVLQGRKADAARLVSQTGKLGRFLVQYLLTVLIIGGPMVAIFGGLGFAAWGMAGSDSLDDFVRHGLLKVVPLLVVATLVLLVPLVYVSLGFAFATQELMYGDCGAWESILRSWKLVSGFRLSVFGFGFIAGWWAWWACSPAASASCRRWAWGSS